MDYDSDMELAENPPAYPVLTGRDPASRLRIRLGRSLYDFGVFASSSHCTEVIPVKNLTFGGTIKTAGLLTVDDYDAAFKDWQAQVNEKPGQFPCSGGTSTRWALT